MNIETIPSYLFTKNIRFVIKAVIWHPDKTSQKFLVIKRSSTEFIRPSTLDIPGGGVHFGELHQDALHREVLEETGLTIHSIQDLILFTSYQQEENIYNIILGVQAISDNNSITLSGEHQQYFWMTKQEFLYQYPKYTFTANRTFNIHSTDFICDIIYKSLEQNSNSFFKKGV